MAKQVDAKIYAKNVLKSAKYIGAETLKGVNPTLTEYISDNVELSKDMYHGVKDFKNTVRNKLTSVLGETGYEDLKNVKKNVFSDLRTGKFYNPEREDANMEKMVAGMGFSFDFDDIDFDVEDPDTSDAKETAAAGFSTIADKLSFSQQKSSQASAELIVKGNSRNTRATLAHTEKMFGAVNNSLAAINSSILYLHNDLATPLNNHIINSNNFYQTATNELAKQTSYLENINKLLTDRFAPVGNGFGASNKAKSPWEMVMGSGLPNFRALGSVAKNKLINDTPLGMITGMLSPEMIQMMLGAGMSSPIALLLTQLLTSKIQNGPTGKALERTVNTLKGGSIHLASKIHAYNKKTHGQGLWGMLSSLVDVVPEKAGKLDFSKYNKGRADWTGKDQKALREVIPTQLAKIISILSGEEAKVFDYETGKWRSSTQVRKDFSRRRIENFGNADRGFKNEVLNEYISTRNRLDSMRGEENAPAYTMSSRAVVSLSKDYDMLMTLLATKGESIASFTTAQDLIRACNTNGWTRSMGTTPPLLDPTNLKSIARIIFRRRTNVTRFQGATYAGRLSDTRFLEANGGGTFANVANGSNLAGAHKVGNLLTSATDEHGHNVFYYLSNILDTLKHTSHRRETGNRRAGYGRNASGNSRQSGVENERVAAQSGQVSDVINGWLIPDNEDNIIHRSTRGDEEGRQRLNSDGEWETPTVHEGTSRGTREKEAKHSKSSLLSRAIDTVNTKLETLLYGDPIEAFKARHKGESFFQVVKGLPKEFANLGKTLMDKVGQWFEKIKSGEFWQKYTGEIKNKIKAAPGKLWGQAKEWGKNVKDFVKPSWAGEVDGESVTASRGGNVTKTGVIVASKGEKIIPAKRNPSYKGFIPSDSDQQDLENQKFWDWMRDGAPGGDYLGSFGKGGTVGRRNNSKNNAGKWPKLSDKRKNKIKSLASRGYTDEEIAKKMGLDVRQIAQITRSNAVKQTVSNAAETVKDTVREKVDEIKGSEKGKKAQELADKAAGIIGKGIEHLFGDPEKFKNAKTTGKTVIDAAKSNLPKTLASGTIGAVVGAAATGSGLGLLGGFVIGAGSEILKNSDELSKKLFGEKDEKGNYSGGKLPPKIANYIKNQLPKTAKAGAIGGILGTLGVAPGGILGGMVLGAGLELVSSTDTFKDLMLGKPDINGNRKGGIVGSVKYHVIDPLINFTKGGLTKLGSFFKDEVFKPITGILSSGKDWIKGKATQLMNAVTDHAKDIVKRTIGEKFDKVFGKVTGAAKKVGKFGLNVAKNVISKPFQVLDRSFKKHNIKAGFSSMTPEERMAYAQSIGKEGIISDYTKWAGAEGRSEEDIRKASEFLNGRSSIKRERHGIRQDLADTITASLENGGIGDPKTVSEIKKLFNTNEVKNGDNYQSIIDKVNELTKAGKIGESESQKLIGRINDDMIKIGDTRVREANFDNNKDEFFKANGLDKLSKRQLKKARLQAGIDAKTFAKKRLDESNKGIADAREADTNKKNAENLLKQQEKESPIDEKRNNILTTIQEVVENIDKKIKGKTEGDKPNVSDIVPENGGTAADTVNALVPIAGAPTENPEQLLKKQEKENPIDQKRNNILVTIKDLLSAIASKLKIKPKDVKSDNPESENLDTPETASDTVNALIPTTDSQASSSEEAQPKKGDVKTEFEDGHPVQYTYDGKQWVKNINDAETKAADEESKTKSKFYEMFVNGGLLNSLKGLFSFGSSKDSEGEEKTSIWDKIGSFASNLFGKTNNILTSIFGALGGAAGIGTVLKTVLPTALIAAGSTYALSKVGENAAGTSTDSGMYKGADAEARQEEVSNYGMLKKANLGVNSIENKIRGRDTTTYNEDDYVTQYETSRVGSRLTKTALTSFNPKLAKAAKTVTSKTIGKIPIVGKAASNVMNLSTKVGKTTTAAAEELLKTKGGKAVASAARKVASSKVGTAVSGIFKNVNKVTTGAVQSVTKSKAATTVANVALKIKDKILAVFKSLISKLGLKASDQVVEEAAERGARAVAEAAPTKLAKSLAKVAVVLNVVFIANAVLEGFQKAKAKTILGIIDDPTVAQRCLAAALNGLNEAIPGIGGIIPTETLFSIMYTVLKWMGCNFGKLDEQRANAKATVEAYNEQNGTTYNIEEYIHNVLGEKTVQDKVKETVKGAGKAIKNFFTGKNKEESDEEKVEAAEGSKLSSEVSANAKKLNSGKASVKTEIVGAGTTVNSLLSTKDSSTSNYKILSGVDSSSSDYVEAAEGSGLVGGDSGNTTSNSTLINNAINQITKTATQKVKSTGAYNAYSKFKSAAGKIDEKAKSTISAMIPEQFKTAGNKIASLFDSISAEIPDLTNLISDLWKLSDPENKENKDYDSVIAKYTPAEGSLMGGFGKGLVKSVAGVMRIINSVVTPFRFISNLVGGTVSKIVNVITGVASSGSTSSDGSSDSSSSSGSWFSRTASKIKNSAKEYWTWIKEKVTGNGSGTADTAVPIHTTQKGNFNKFGSTNIDQSGCGPAVASTVLKAYGKNVGINKAAKYAEKKNYVAGASNDTATRGTRASYFSDILGSNGIQTSYTDNASQIASSVKSGKPTILLGQDKSNNSKAKSPFGPNPHYVVARGTDSKGNVIVDDPELSTTTTYNKNILKHTKLGIATGGYSGVEGLVSAALGNVMGNVASSLSGTTAGKILSLIFGSDDDEDDDESSDEDSTSDDNGTYTVDTSADSSAKAYNGIFTKISSLSSIGSDYTNLYNNSSSSKPGISTCATGVPTTKGYNVISNDVGWACARFNHIYNLLTGYSGLKYPDFCCNPERFLEVASRYGLTKSFTPQVGAIMVWREGKFADYTDGVGHVAIVEEVNSDTEVVTSESSAQNYQLKNVTRKKGDNGNWGMEKNAGYIFCGFIYNPGVEEYIKANAAKTTSSSGSKFSTNDQQEIWNLLIGLGATKIGAAAGLGCMIAESAGQARRIEGDYLEGFSTKMGYNGYGDASKRNAWFEVLSANTKGGLDPGSYTGSDGSKYPGIGCAQWTAGRGENFWNYMQKNHYDWGLMVNQGKFMIEELQKSYPYVLNNMKVATNLNDATRYFALKYENGNFTEDKIKERQAYALQMYNKFANSGSTSTSAEGSGINLHNFNFNSAITKATGIPKSKYIGGDSGILRAVKNYGLYGGAATDSTTTTTNSTTSKKTALEQLRLTQAAKYYKSFKPIDLKDSSTYVKDSNGNISAILESDATRVDNDPSKPLKDEYVAEFGSGSGINRTRGFNFRNNRYTGGASGVSSSTSSTTNINLNTITGYLKTIADNTKYNSAIPEIVDVINDSIDAIASLAGGKSTTSKSTTKTNATADADSYQETIESNITLMRAKLEAISKTL